MLTDDEKIQNALQAEFAKQGGGIQEVNGESLDFSPNIGTEEEVKQETSTEPPVSTEQKSESAPLSEETKQDSSLTQKSFEELLSERTGGKYKSWDDIEKTITAPREYKSRFAEKIEEYVNAGGNEDEYFRIQSINFDKMSEKELLEYKIQAEDPDMSQEEIDYEMKRRYGVDKWKKDPLDYEEGTEPEEIKIQKIRYAREASKARETFKAHQDKLSAPPVKDNSAEVARNEKAAQDWDNKAREAVSSIGKLSLKVSDTEAYDFAIDDAQKTEVQKIVNELRTDSTKFWEPFKQQDGAYDLRRMAEAIFKLRNFDKAVMLAADQHSKKGAKAVVTDLKNSTLKPVEEKPDSDKPLSLEQQLAQQFKNSLT